MSHLIKVINKNNFEITDYFEGICYVFTPDVAINVPLDAMKHIFGVDFPADDAVLKSRVFRDDVFNTVARRWGWNSSKEEERAKHKRALDSISFIPIVTQVVEVVASNTEIAAPREQKVPTKAAGKFKPRADEAEEPSEEEVA